MKKVKGRKLTVRQQENIVCRHWSLAKQGRRGEFNAFAKKIVSHLSGLAVESKGDGLQRRASSKELYRVAGIDEHDFVGYGNGILLALVRAEQSPGSHLAFDSGMKGGWWKSDRPQDLAPWLITRAPSIITELEKLGDVLTLLSVYGHLESVEDVFVDALGHKVWSNFLRLIEVVRSSKGPQFSAPDMAEKELRLLSDNGTKTTPPPKGKTSGSKWTLVDPAEREE